MAHIFRRRDCYSSQVYQRGDKYYVAKWDVRQALQSGTTSREIDNPADSPYHTAINDFTQYLYLLDPGKLTIDDDLEPYHTINNAALMQVATGELDRTSLATAIIDQDDAWQDDMIKAKMREQKVDLAGGQTIKPKRAGHTHARTARAAQLFQPSPEWIRRQAKQIVEDKAIGLALLDRALDGRQDAVELRAVWCLDRGLHPLSTPEKLVTRTKDTWIFRRTVLRHLNVPWARRDDNSEPGGYIAARHQAVQLQLIELKRAIQTPSLYQLFGLPTPEALCLIGPEIIRQRLTTNLAFPKPPQKARGSRNSLP